MTETDAEDRNARRRLADEIEADASLVRRAGAGREHNGVRLRRHHVGDRNLVVAMHDDVRPQPAQVMDQVEGEAVVVVDQYYHCRLKPLYYKALISGNLVSYPL